MPQNDQPVLSVSELNQFARGTLEMHVGKVWVSGEVSNFSTPASGHWYFTLKDDRAQIRCAMFKGRNQFIRTRLQSGMQIMVNGKVSLYEGRGDYQLIADYLEESGVGAMARAYEALKQKLSQEGLFDQQWKKPLPKQLSSIAVITSDTGAAIHDITSVLKERFPSLKVTLIPAAVQGEQAPRELARGLYLAQQFAQKESLDAIIIGRGGGSAEDLWAFNNEVLAREIFACSIPVISAVGHEVDVTIADLVADVRAPTPSAAAEMISPDQDNLRQHLDFLEDKLIQLIQTKLYQYKQILSIKEKQIQHPSDIIDRVRLRFDHFEDKLKQNIKHQLAQASNQLQRHHFQLLQQNPINKLQKQQNELTQLQQRIEQSIKQTLRNKKNQLAQHSAELELLSPLSTLSRGYSISKLSSGEILTQAEQAKAGDTIETLLSNGRITSTVTDCHSE